MNAKVRRAIAIYFFFKAGFVLLFLPFSGYPLLFIMVGLLILMIPLTLAGYSVLSKRRWAALLISVMSLALIAMGLVDISEYQPGVVNLSYIAIGALDAFLAFVVWRAHSRIESK